MAACKNDVLLNKIYPTKLDDRVEVDIDIHRDLDDCRKLSANSFVSNTYETAVYSRYKIPQNQFECLRGGCVNTGTLYNNSGSSESVVYKLPWDATEFASGVITFYVQQTTASYPVSVSVTISDTQTGTNSDTYTVSVTEAMVGSDGFAPVVIDLSQTPTSTTGTGYEASASGAYLTIAGIDIAFSSIAVFDSIQDFIVNDVVKVSCLSSLGSDLTWSTLEASCIENGYDTSADPSFDVTVTGKLLTPNYFAANPALVRGDATIGFDMVTEEYTVTSQAVNLIHVADVACGFVSVQLADYCVSNSILNRISIPVTVALGDDQYQVIYNSDGSATVKFGAGLEGQKVLVSYPKAVDVEEEIMDYAALDRFHARLSYPMTMSDGTKYRFVFEDVLVTGFPMTQSNSDQDVSFTLRIQKGKFRKYRIIGANGGPNKSR